MTNLAERICVASQDIWLHTPMEHSLTIRLECWFCTASSMTELVVKRSWLTASKSQRRSNKTIRKRSNVCARRSLNLASRNQACVTFMLRRSSFEMKSLAKFLRFVTTTAIVLQLLIHQTFANTTKICNSWLSTWMIQQIGWYLSLSQALLRLSITGDWCTVVLLTPV